MKKLDYIITGTGRSGTVYMSEVLTSLGIPCGHETIFNRDGIDKAIDRLEGREPCDLSTVSKTNVAGKNPGSTIDFELLRADSSYMAAPFLDHQCLEGTTIIHVIRDPVKVVNSFVNYLGYFRKPEPCSEHGQEYEAFILRHLPELTEEMSTYERACLYYVRWNEMVEKKARNYVRFRAEEGPLPILKFLGLPPNTPVFDDRRANTFELPQAGRFVLDELPRGRVRSMFYEKGRSYGYRLLENILI